MAVIYNNLCPTCLVEYQRGVDIQHKTTLIKIYPNQVDSPSVLVCVHADGSSLLDMGECTNCQKAGICLPPEEQRGAYVGRDIDLVTLEIGNETENRGMYCPKCVPTVVCEYCKQPTNVLFDRSIDNVDLKVCKSCVSDTSPCSICKETYTYRHEDLDDYICAECIKHIVMCPSCGIHLPRKEDLIQFGDTFGCEHCVRINTCLYCSERTQTRYIYSVGHICGEHFELVKNLPAISGYHHTKVTQFYKTPNEKNTNLFFGIENEVQILLSPEAPPSKIPIYRGILIKEALTLFPDLDCKRDSSISYIYQRESCDAGVELVWQPLTWGWFKENKPTFKELFSKITPMLRKNMSQAGMHVHISKKAFTPLHFLKFTNFFYMQEKSAFLRVVAGRGANNYARIRGGYSLDGRQYGLQHKGKNLIYHEIAKREAARECGTSRLKYAQTYHVSTDRYECINTTNKNTYEVRIFKGARTYDEFIRRFTFVHSIYEYTRTVSRKDLSLDDYFTFIKANKKEYPELTKLVIKFEKKL